MYYLYKYIKAHGIIEFTFFISAYGILVKIGKKRKPQKLPKKNNNNT
jgi:hypothetical protein